MNTNIQRDTILILEDDEDRVRGFHDSIVAWNPEFRLRVWHTAPSMIRECGDYFDCACLFSLDHDLNPRPDATEDPGCGLDVASFLCQRAPFCPVLLHSSNYERVWSMHNEFRFAGWPVDRVGPIGNDWIPTLWLPKIKSLLSKSAA